MSRKLVALILMGLLIGAVFVPATAQAGTAVGAVSCKTDAFTWPGAGGGFSCTGNAFGVDASAGANCVVGAGTAGCAFRADVATYSELCGVDPNVPPVAGFATGSLHLDHDNNGTLEAHGTFNWVRVGLTAVLLPLGADSVGVAAFVPHTSTPGVVPTCNAPDTGFTADVAGVGVLDL